MIASALGWAFVGFLISKAVRRGLEGQSDEDYIAGEIADWILQDLDVEEEIYKLYPDISRGVYDRLIHKAEMSIINSEE